MNSLLPFFMGLVALAFVFVGLVLLCPAAALVGAGLLLGRVAFVMDQGTRK
jgi:hypothetical protein